jgi:hypothetical protein
MNRVVGLRSPEADVGHGSRLHGAVEFNSESAARSFTDTDQCLLGK